MSAQAVGGAVGHNPIGIIIPCHRVVGADGSLTDLEEESRRRRRFWSWRGLNIKIRAFLQPD